MQPSIESRKVNDLVPYARNSRTHSEEQIGQIAASIREFGWTSPLLINADNGIIAGHGRLRAAHRLNLDEVPVIVLDHLTKEQQKALIIADNKIASNAGWDEELLALEVSELETSDFDPELLGFDEAGLDAIMFEPDIQPVSIDEQSRLDEKQPVKCPACGHEF